MTRDELIVQALMSTDGKAALRDIINLAGAKFADSSVPGSISEAIGRAVAGLPPRHQDKKYISVMRGLMNEQKRSC